MWVEKYRPRSLSELIGQPEAIAVLRNLASHFREGRIVHALLIGPPGCGKTSAGIAFTREVFGANWRRFYIELNASDERGINTIRSKIKRLAQASGKRIVFLDEADQLTSDAQHALRRIMERTQGTMFILTGNHAHKIIDAIKSRCVNIIFRRLSDEEVANVIIYILKSEKINITKEEAEGLTYLVKTARGDLRWAINTLEALVSQKRKITVSAIINTLRPRFALEALRLAVSGDFTRAREMIEDAFIETRFSVDAMIEELYGAIKDLDGIGDDVKIKLYAKLAEAERGIRLGANPIVQIVAFIADAWVLPHLPKCPAIRRR